MYVISLLMVLAITALPAAALAAETAREPLPFLVVGDYHIGQGRAPVQTVLLLRAAGYDAFGHRIGGIHSDIRMEWKDRAGGHCGSQPYIEGQQDIQRKHHRPAPFARHAETLAKYRKQAEAPAPACDPLVRNPDRKSKARYLVAATKQPATREQELAWRAYDTWQKALGTWLGARLRGVKPKVVVVACAAPNPRRKGEISQAWAEAIGGFRDLIKANGGRMVLAATVKWTPERPAPDKRLATLDAELKLYRAWHEDLGVTVAPINLAWHMALLAAAKGEVRFLACKDGHGHYGEQTAYLSACVLAATILDRDIADLPGLAELDPRFATLNTTLNTALTPEQSAALRTIAWQAVSEWKESLK